MSPVSPGPLCACGPGLQRPRRMGASCSAVEKGDIFGPQEAYLWPYVSKDAQYGACIDTHVKGRLGPVEGLFDLNPVLPEQCRDRAVGTLRKDKRAITTAIQITDEAQNRNMTAPDSIPGEGETDRRWFTVYHGPTSYPLCISRPHCCARPQERRVGQECVRTCRTSGSP